MAKKRIVSKKPYSPRSLYKEREYGFYWYNWLWSIARPVMIFGISLIITVGIVLNAWSNLYETFLMPVDPADDSTIPFRIESGDYVATIARNLEEQGFLRNKSLFRYMIMFQGLTNKLQYGEYQLSRSMGIGEIISTLTSGSPSVERQIRIIPGWTIDDIAEYLVKVGALKDTAEFLELANDLNLFVDDYHQLQKAQESGLFDGRKYALEGYLAPDTYRVLISASPESILRTLLAQQEIVLDRLNNTENADSSFETYLTQDQIIVMASMIEREAGQAEDFARVSAVFYNRLARGMKLESDPTVTYTLGITRMALTSEDTATVSPYNTYMNNGLPVGPICNPSTAALTAALYPDQTYLDEGYLFFCSKEPDSGELYFSKTYEEHAAAVAQYRPLWEAYDAEQAAKATATAQP